MNKWWDTHKGDYGSSIYDVCRSCATDVDADPELLEPYHPGEPLGDAWQEELSRPSYDEDDYSCELCHVNLTERKDG